MPITNDERAKINRAIERLEEKIKPLAERLSELSQFHAAAWADYGSELCSGEMIADENRLRSEIRKMEDQVFALKKVLAGEIDVSSERIWELEEKLKTEKEKLKYTQARSESLGGLIVSVREIRELIDAG